MKQYIIVIVSVIAILLLNFYQISFLNDTKRYVLADLNDIENALNRKDFEGILTSINELENTWRNIEKGWDIFGEHDDVKEINEHIARIKIYAKYNEESELAMEIANLETIINHVVDSENLSFSNVL